jgi:hypothetical protein
LAREFGSNASLAAEKQTLLKDNILGESVPLIDLLLSIGPIIEF